MRNQLDSIVHRSKSKVQSSIAKRIEELKTDNTDHTFVYSLLGVCKSDHEQIDYYQNIGRIVYKHAGSIIEETVRSCFSNAKKIRIPNTISNNPKTFEIDCCIDDQLAIEIKWRDSTTDGDHIQKEKNRILSITSTGRKPIRLMFFEPNRENAKRIQTKLKELYAKCNGEYYSGQDAWDYVKKQTGIDLYKELNSLIDR